MMRPNANEPRRMSQDLTVFSVPLFPLGTVLYPGGFLPLQIFEVRYLDMIGKCQSSPDTAPQNTKKATSQLLEANNSNECAV